MKITWLAVLVVLLVAAVGLCPLGGHDGAHVCPSMLPEAAGGSLVSLLPAGLLAMAPAPPHSPLVPSRTSPAPV